MTATPESARRVERIVRDVMGDALTAAIAAVEGTPLLPELAPISPDEYRGAEMQREVIARALRELRRGLA